MKKLTTLEKKLKKIGFYQYRKMAQRFKDGKGYAIVRYEDSWSIYRLYYIDSDGSINFLCQTTKNRLAHYKPLHRFLITRNLKYMTPPCLLYTSDAADE